MVEARVAILGGKGMLGSDLVFVCQQHRLITRVLDLPEFDITNENHLANALKDVDAVINCAAYTNVEKAESESERAYKVNAEAVGRLGSAAKKAGVWVLHISTDFVFDGTSDKPYVETDTPNPINVYGASKLAGEKLLVENRCQYCIMRVEWTYGLAGDNFVAKLIKRAKAGGRIKVVDDQIGSPTATIEIAKAICRLLPNKPEGLFHFASAGYVSRFEMAKFIFEKLNMSVDLSSCKTADFSPVAARPLNSCFNCGKIESLLGEQIAPWQVSLERFLEKL
jgi:dTDP-4-dehydrorhamnose reductase